MRFYSLEKLINLHDDYRRAFKIDEHTMLLTQVNGELHLVEGLCPHRGHPLLESDINENCLRCPLHGYTFNLSSGEVLQANDEPCRSLKIYPLVFQDKEVGITL